MLKLLHTQAGDLMHKPLSLLLDQPQLLDKLVGLLGPLSTIPEAAEQADRDPDDAPPDPAAKLTAAGWRASAEASVIHSVVLIHQQPGERGLYDPTTKQHHTRLPVACSS